MYHTIAHMYLPTYEPFKQHTSALPPPQVLAAAMAVRLMPGLDPENDLCRIATIVHQSLDMVLLRLWPVLFQYSVTESVEGDPRVLYPDFSRIRYLMKKVSEMRVRGGTGRVLLKGFTGY